MTLPLVLAVLLLQHPDSATAQLPYWQQHVEYDITARLNEAAGVLNGHEVVRYVNRSPDTLSTFSLHLHLNAFRPGSIWAADDSVEGRRRFNDLEDPDYAFNHVREVEIMGQPVTAIYPYAPDSTIVRFVLPRPLPPGDTMRVEMDWDARPSTVPRRQGRRDRHFDFAQWYPKVVVYDTYGWNEKPLHPAGEFYGEFAEFRVLLDVPSDQVIGATGVPVCGDPGWAGANQASAQPIDYRRDFYDGRSGIVALNGGCAIHHAGDSVALAPGSGRKVVGWYAEQVHHFAVSMSPNYRYEGGHFGDVAIHVLYQPGDEDEWGNGVAVARTATALAWLDSLYGPFVWPQMTNVHRIEGGGTEFPMMVMNGSASQGLIVHEVGHNYTMGILANNEWRNGWMDEGFTSFQTTWFWESQGRTDAYRDLERMLLQLALTDHTEPVSLVSDAYRDFVSYNLMIYGRGELFLHQLRYVVGDSTMRRILRRYYDRWQLKHVDQQAFQSVAEAECGCDLSTLFNQWLHGTPLFDYGVGRTERERLPDGRWRTRIEVERHDEGRIPVEVAVVSDGDTAVVRAEGLAEREWVELVTAGEPDVVILDPRVRTHDWNMLNNRKTLGGGFLHALFGNGYDPGADHYIDTYFSTPTHRDRMAVGWMPTVWHNDAGGVTLGIRSRQNYLGLFERNEFLVSASTGWEAEGEGVEDVDFFFRLQNPTWLQSPNLSQTIEAFSVEGRYGGRLALERTRRDHLAFGPVHRQGIALQWVHPDDFRYLSPGFYEDVGTVELQLSEALEGGDGPWVWSLTSELAGGVMYNRDGLDAVRTDLDPFYGRIALEGTARRDLGGGFAAAARLFGGAAATEGAAPKQRQVYFQGADPLQYLTNPFLRSQGALLRTDDDIHYHEPGGANLRGIAPELSTVGVVALNLELERALLERPRAGLFNRVAVAAFADLSHAIDDGTIARAIDEIDFLGDAGVGIRIGHRIGETEFVTRFDFPLWVSRPELAQGADAGDGEFELRWVFGFEEAF